MRPSLLQHARDAGVDLSMSGIWRILRALAKCRIQFGIGLPRVRRLTGLPDVPLPRRSPAPARPAATRPPSWPLCSSEFRAASTGPRGRGYAVGEVRAPGAVLGAGIALRKCPIGSSGAWLMRLAESLLRVPDTPSRRAHGRPTRLLIPTTASQAVSRAGQLGHPVLKQLLPGAQDDGGLLKRLGAQTVVTAGEAIQLLAGSSCSGAASLKAQAEAAAARREARSCASASTCMLGEGAHRGGCRDAT